MIVFAVSFQDAQYRTFRLTDPFGTHRRAFMKTGVEVDTSAPIGS